jgi:hypothetical protein
MRGLMPSETGTAEPLSHSRLAVYRKCPKAYEWAYVHNLTKDTDDEPLIVGGSLHSALDVLKKGGVLGDAMADIQAAYKNCPLTYDITKWRAMEAMTLALLMGYEWRWRDDGWKVVASEVPCSVPIINPRTNRRSRNYFQHLIIDLIVELPDGRLAVVDHKTTGEAIEPGSRYYRRLPLDSQLTGYFAGAKKAGFDVDCIIYDVIRKPGTSPLQVPAVDEDGFKIVLGPDRERAYLDNGKPRQAARKAEGEVMVTSTETSAEYLARLRKIIHGSHEEYFQRVEVPRTQGQIDLWNREMWRLTKRLSEDKAADIWVRNPENCHRPFPCPFFELCGAGVTDLSAGIPSGFRTKIGAKQHA